eukprot:6911-Heterococcus_DN1.PRE.10
MISAQDEGAAHYYVKYALENIRAFTLEWDDYKIRQLLEKGERDRRYVMRKYGLHDTAMNSKIDYMKGMAPPQRIAFVDINDEDFEDPELEAARKAYDDIDVFKRH